MKDSKSTNDIDSLGVYIHDLEGVWPVGEGFRCEETDDGRILCYINYEEFTVITYGEDEYFAGFPKGTPSLRSRAKYCSWVFGHSANLSKRDARKIQWRIYEEALDPEITETVLFESHDVFLKWELGNDREFCRVQPN